MFLYILIFVISFIFLIKAGATLVRSLTKLARFFQVSEYVIAFFLMSFATSIPELFVGLSSALEDIPRLSLGNIIGANFINVTLIMGVIVLLNRGIKIESKISQENFWLIFFLVLFPIFLSLDGMISRSDGVILLLAFILYLASLIKEKEYFTKTIKSIEFNHEISVGVFKWLGRFLLGIIILLLSSFALVWAGKQLIFGLGISALFFGIIFVALATTVPELVFGIRASLLKHTQMSIGNTMGSVAFNSAFIIALVSIVNPIQIDNNINFFFAIIFLIAAMLLLNIFVYTRSNISSREGIILIGLYIFFLVIQYLFYTI
ncbi:MAG: hypothetical protein AB1643_00525 [Patescibacteria group bacterium]